MKEATAKARSKRLKEIPGDVGLPFFGDMFAFLKDPIGLQHRKLSKYGEIFKGKFLGRDQVTLMGKEANKFLLVEQSKYISSQKAWELNLEQLFPNGLMLMDGERHQYHRSILRSAFQKDPLNGYLLLMRPIIDQFMEEIQGKKKFLAFHEIKELTLAIAGKVFFGLSFSKDLELVNKAIVDVVKASTTLPLAIPYSTFWRGLKGRKTLETYFGELILQKRKNPGKDLFSMLCQAENEDGDTLSDKEIIDHVIFILMAAHDTTASTITSMLYLLAKHPDWQEALFQEAQNLSLLEVESTKDLRGLQKMSLVIKEVLRMYPPLIVIPRYTTQDIQYGEYTIPKDVQVSVIIQHNHYNDQVWDEPEKFDPERFSSQRKEQNRCPHAYAPFGAGPHYCLGFAFAEMQIKMIVSAMLTSFRWSVPEGYEAPYHPIPIQEPKDGLPLFLAKR